MNSLSKLVAICAGGIVAALLLVFLVAKPLLNNVVSLNAELSRKKIEVKTLEQQIIAYKTAQSDLSKVTEKETVFNAIVDRENLVVPIQSLEAAAAISNTDQTLRIQEPVAGQSAPADPILTNHAGVEEVPYVVSALNDYDGLVKYLRYLEHLPQLTEISEIEFTAQATEREHAITHTGQARATINGVFFVKTK